MYRLTCDGLPLLDWRDDDMVLVDPKLKLEVNKVGEGSFTIYKNHPHYGSLKKLKSVFEVSDDNGVIFRGRATGDTVDLDHGMAVDMEGAMAYFNDSVVRTFNFPKDFNVKGDKVAFFLGWLIDNHNSQVQDFQKLKLGNVTVKDENFSRYTNKMHSTWDIIHEKLCGSSLGGYLCVRYEEDGNYIDYLSEFTETNSQEIVFGENLLDMKHETEASTICSAIIPIGALELTISNRADGNITDDIVKTGDTLYSKNAVEEYGWIYAPTSETTWEDLTDEAELLTTGVEWLTKGSVPMSAIEATAVDLHFTDEQVESLRIYKNVNVRSAPHDVAESFPLSKLEIELLNPQNTKVTVGKKIKTLTEKTALEQEKAQDKYSKLSKTDEEIRLEVQDEIKKLGASVDVSLDSISLEIQGVDDKCTELAVTLDGVTVTDAGGTTKIKGDSIETDNLHVKAANIDGTLTADQIVLDGAITWGDLDSGVQNSITVKSQFSPDGSSNWSDTQRTTDKYRRDWNHSTNSWGVVYQFVGSDGKPGKDGQDGADGSDGNPAAYLRSIGITEITSGSVKSPKIEGGEIWGAEFYGQEFNIYPEVNGDGALNLYGKFANTLHQVFEISYADSGYSPITSLDNPSGGTISIGGDSEEITFDSTVQFYEKVDFNNVPVEGLNVTATAVWG